MECLLHQGIYMNFRNTLKDAFSSLDLFYMKRYIVGTFVDEYITENIRKCADYTNDSKITTLDYFYFKRCIQKKRL